MYSDDGYIKNACSLDYCPNIEIPYFEDLSVLRSRLYKLRLIGQYPDGVSFGNISHRIKDNEIIITGTNTGGKAVLEPCDFSYIYEFSIKNNSLKCRGAAKASSESLTHLAIYENSEAEIVVHIHSLRLWEKLLNFYPTTSINAKFGTTEIAEEVKGLILKHEMNNSGIIISEGHKEGIFIFDTELINIYDAISRIISD